VPAVKPRRDAERSKDRDPIEVASKIHDVAVSYCARGKHIEARSLCLRSLRLLRAALGAHSPDVANVLHTLAATYEQTSDPSTAEKIYLRSLRTVEKAARDTDVDTLHIQVLTSLARLCRAEGRYGEAEPMAKRARALAEERFDSQDPQVAQGLANLAAVYQDTRRFAQACRLYQRVLGIAEQSPQADESQLAAAYRNLAALEHARGRDKAAEPFAARAVEIREKALGPEHPDVGADVALLAAILAGRKRFEEAEPLYRRALKVFENVYGREHAEVAAVLNNLAALYQARGEGHKPELLYKRVLAIKEKLLGPEHPDVATTLNNLAVLYKGLERFSDARQFYERTLTIFEKNLGATHPKVAQTLANYARMLRAEAESLDTRAERIESDLKMTEAARAPKIDPRIARFRLSARPSRIHRWGIYAEETIPADREVIEYTGKRISRGEAKRRAGRKLQYLFVIDKYWKIDGAIGGSGAQYINHSCDPNIVARKIEGRIFYFSKRRIAAGEELLVDYKFAKRGARVPCHCGAAKCRGTINLK
jgi:tetratricopeptide (TPR) repeat protein